MLGPVTWLAAAVAAFAVCGYTWPRRDAAELRDAVPVEAASAWMARQRAHRRAMHGEIVEEQPTYPVEISLLRRELARVGLHASQDPPIVLLLVGWVLLMLPLLAIFDGLAGGRSFAGVFGWCAVVVPTAAMWWRRRERVRRSMRQALPSALSMLASQLSSGRSFDVAIAATAQEMLGFVPELSEELFIVSEHVRMGVSRTRAFEAMAARTGIKELGSMGRLLKVDVGGALSPALRAYAELLEQQRMSAAEERAGKVPAKLTAVMITTMIPPLMVLILSPAFITLYETL